MKFLPLVAKPKVGDTIYYITPDAEPIPLTVRGFCGDGDRILKFESQYMDDQIIWKFVPNELAPREYNEYLFVAAPGARHIPDNWPMVALDISQRGKPEVLTLCGIKTKNMQEDLGIDRDQITCQRCLAIWDGNVNQREVSDAN